MKISLFLFFFIPSLWISAQRDTSIHDNFNKVSVSLSTGIGFPLFDFASKNVPEIGSEIGAADIGSNLLVSARFYSRRSKSGFYLMFSVNSNKADINSYFNPNFSQNTPGNYYKMTNVNEGAGNYNLFNLLCGYSIDFKAGKIGFDLRVLLGFSYFDSPEIYYSYTALYGTTGYTNSAYSDNIYSSGSTIATAADIGLAIRYQITNKLFFLLNSDIFISYPRYNTEYSFTENPSQYGYGGAFLSGDSK